MDWTRYSETPDEGTFERIERTLRRRRNMRRGGVAAVVVVAGVGALLAGRLLAGGDVEVQTASTMPDTRMVETPMPEMVKVATKPAETMPIATSKVEPSQPQPAAATETMVAEEQIVQPTPRAEAVVAVVPMTVAEAAQHGEAAAQKTEPEPQETAVAIADEPPATTVQKSEPKSNERPQNANQFSILKCPNIIVPTADEDDNRYFSVTPMETIGDFHLQIFSRRGVRVYTTSDVAFRWDGKCEGMPVEQGAYVWVATFRDAHGKACSERGTVMVVR